MTIYLCALILSGGVVLIVPPGDENPRSLYERAAQLIASREPASAVEPLESLVQRHSDSLLAQIAVVHLAECYLIEGHAQKAYQLLHDWNFGHKVVKAAELTSVDLKEKAGQLKTRAARERAVQAERETDPAQALAWLGRAMQSASGHAREEIERERLRVGIVACRRLARSGRNIQSILDEFEESQQAAVRFALVESLIRAGDHKHVGSQLTWLAEHLRNLDALPPWAATVMLRRCERLVGQKQYTAATTLLSNARAAYSDSPIAHEYEFLLARCAIAQLDFDSAETHLRNITVPQDQARARAHWMLGEVFFLRKELRQAIDEYSEALTFDAPQWQSRALLQTAKCQQLLGDQTAATATYRTLQARFGDTDSGKHATFRVATLPHAPHRQLQTETQK